MFDFFLFFLSFLLFKPIKPLLLFFFLLWCWLIGCRVHWNCTWTEHLNDKKWTTAAFRIQRKKLLFYSGWVILQRPAALLIILKTQPAVHMWCEEKSVRRVPESRRAVRGRLQFTSLRQQNKKKTHTYTMRSTVWLDEGRRSLDRQEVLCSNWCWGGLFLTDGSLNVSSAITSSSL